MTMTLNRCPSSNHVTHQHIYLQVFTFMVPQLKPLDVSLNEFVVTLVFYWTPIVIRVLWFLLLVFMFFFMRFRFWMILPGWFLNKLLFHVISWTIGTAIAACIGTGSLGKNLLIFDLITEKGLSGMGEGLEWVLLVVFKNSLVGELLR